LGNGSFVLTKQIPNMETRLGIKNGTHLDSFSSLIELDEKIRYYINNEHIRKQIEENAEHYASTNRTWTHVAKEILNYVTNKKCTFYKL
jgi:spore maturation protein CgeB